MVEDGGGALSPRELEGKLNDLRALLASSKRHVDELAAEEARVAAREAELVAAAKKALQAGDRATAREHAVELERVRADLKALREQLGALRRAHDELLVLAQRYESVLDRPRAREAPAATRISVKTRALAERWLAPEKQDEVVRLARTAASNAATVASRGFAWLRELVEPATGEAPGPGQAAFDRGDHARTIAQCTRVLEREPRNAVAHCNRGAALAMLGRPREALADYDAALALEPDHALTWSNRADARLTLDDFPGAIADATRALAIDPSLALALFNRGRARASLGQWAAAEQDFRESARHSPGHALSHAHLAIARLACGDARGSVASATRALELAPGLPIGLGARARARLALGDLEGALEDADALVERRRQPGDRLLRARIQKARGDATEARAEIEREAALAPDETARVLVRASWLVEVEDLEGALALLDAAIDHGPAAALLGLRGEVQSRRGEPEAALADLDRAVALDPGDPALLETRGRASFAAGEPLRALEDADASLARGHEGARDVRGFARWELLDLEGALADLELARGRDPGNAAAHEACGRIHAILGDRKRAREALERAVALDPRRGHALLWLVALGGDPARLDEVVAGRDWLAELAKLVRAETSADAVLELARLAETEGERRERLADAHAFAGFLAERAGDLGAAIAHYEAGLGAGAGRDGERAWLAARLAHHRAGSPLSDDVRLERLHELGVISSEELGEAKALLEKEE